MSVNRYEMLKEKKDEFIELPKELSSVKEPLTPKPELGGFQHIKTTVIAQSAALGLGTSYGSNYDTAFLSRPEQQDRSGQFISLVLPSGQRFNFTERAFSFHTINSAEVELGIHISTEMANNISQSLSEIRHRAAGYRYS